MAVEDAAEEEGRDEIERELVEWSLFQAFAAKGKGKGKQTGPEANGKGKRK
jgi:hypothetical protein